MSFFYVDYFEKQIADFYQAPYAVAVDSCTHAIELCVRHLQPRKLSVPSRTYISVPMIAIKTNVVWEWNDAEWHHYYQLSDCNIIDAAVYWKPGGYITNSFMCLSFQYKKHLSLGRGGAILCSKYSDYVAFKKLSYDGRLPLIPWAEQNIDTLGYHYYMTPETAQLGIEKLPHAIKTMPPERGYKDYPDLTNMRIFNVLK